MADHFFSMSELSSLYNEFVIPTYGRFDLDIAPAALRQDRAHAIRIGKAEAAGQTCAQNRAAADRQKFSSREAVHWKNQGKRAANKRGQWNLPDSSYDVNNGVHRARANQLFNLSKTVGWVEL